MVWKTLPSQWPPHWLKEPGRDIRQTGVFPCGGPGGGVGMGVVAGVDPLQSQQGVRLPNEALPVWAKSRVPALDSLSVPEGEQACDSTVTAASPGTAQPCTQPSKAMQSYGDTGEYRGDDDRKT